MKKNVIKDFGFKHKDKSYLIKVKECKSILQRAVGLMFRTNSLPLLFSFDKPTRQSIHSFFCQPFIAIWFNDGKIVDVKFVKPWRISVKSSKKFDKLLEIPMNDINFIKFVDERNI